MQNFVRSQRVQEIGRCHFNQIRLADAPAHDGPSPVKHGACSTAPVVLSVTLTAELNVVHCIREHGAWSATSVMRVSYALSPSQREIPK